MALFKAFVAKALRDFPTTSALLNADRIRPVLGRLGLVGHSRPPSGATSQPSTALRRPNRPRMREYTRAPHV